MKALTVRQPHAQLIALGVKTIETKSKPTKYRGRLLIHAGTERVHPGKFIFLSRKLLIEGRIDQTAEQRIRRAEVPFGAIISSCNLVDCVPIVGAITAGERIPAPSLRAFRNAEGKDLLWLRTREPIRWSEGDGLVDTTNQLPYGDFTPGRYALLLEDIKPVERRCPACWGTGEDWVVPGLSCPICRGRRVCDPIPAKGKQGLWEWLP